VIVHCYYLFSLDGEIALRKSLEVNPKFDRSLYYLGASLRAQGKHDDAIVAYRNCVLYSPKNWNGYHDLAMLLNLKGEKKEAILTAKKAATHLTHAALLWASLILEQSLEEQTIDDLTEVEKILTGSNVASTNGVSHLMTLCNLRMTDLKRRQQHSMKFGFIPCFIFFFSLFPSFRVSGEM
jgi:tetratricopeptide (TPR) repeat protein